MGDGVLGEFGLLVMLAAGVDDKNAAAADGWGGDRHVAYRSGSRSCVRGTVAMDSPVEAAQLSEVAQRWAAKHGQANIAGTGAGTLTFTACA